MGTPDVQPLKRIGFVDAPTRAAIYPECSTVHVRFTDGKLRSFRAADELTVVSASGVRMKMHAWALLEGDRVVVR